MEIRIGAQGRVACRFAGCYADVSKGGVNMLQKALLRYFAAVLGFEDANCEGCIFAVLEEEAFPKYRFRSFHDVVGVCFTDE